MKKSTKAALISALVFPGAGHLYLKRYLPGILMALGAVAALYILMSTAVDTAFGIASKIETGSVPLDANVIANLVSQQSPHAELVTNICSIALLILWVIGIVDAYRLALLQERRDPRITSKEIKP